MRVTKLLPPCYCDSFLLFGSDVASHMCMCDTVNVDIYWTFWLFSVGDWVDIPQSCGKLSFTAHSCGPASLFLANLGRFLYKWKFWNWTRFTGKHYITTEQHWRKHSMIFISGVWVISESTKAARANAEEKYYDHKNRLFDKCWGLWSFKDSKISLFDDNQWQQFIPQLSVSYYIRGYIFDIF